MSGERGNTPTFAAVPIVPFPSDVGEKVAERLDEGGTRYSEKGSGTNCAQHPPGHLAIRS
jgi:hypothetical protein